MHVLVRTNVLMEQGLRSSVSLWGELRQLRVLTQIKWRVDVAFSLTLRNWCVMDVKVCHHWRHFYTSYLMLFSLCASLYLSFSLCASLYLSLSLCLFVYFRDDLYRVELDNIAGDEMFYSKVSRTLFLHHCSLTAYTDTQTHKHTNTQTCTLTCE